MPSLSRHPRTPEARQSARGPSLPAAIPPLGAKTRNWFQAQLLGWYARAQRDLPWRRSADPYAIWVSEIMLQQTQVATVLTYYTRWMRLFPTLKSLARAPLDDVLHAWQGLGYYRRARNLKRAAEQVLRDHDGTVPADVATLQELPGVGRYTAGAIASIAFGQATPIVDGNVIRLLCRFFGLASDPTRAPLKAQLWQLAEDLIPVKNARDFNQALMEMGATCCTPKQPLCGHCPLATKCHAHQTNSTERFPALPARVKITQEHHVALLAEKNGSYLLEQRPAQATRWAGLWQFPNTKIAARQTVSNAVQKLASDTQLQITPPTPLVSLTHSVTRYRISLDAFHCTVKQGTRTPRSSDAKRWVHPDDLPRYALPAPHARIATALRAIDAKQAKARSIIRSKAQS